MKLFEQESKSNNQYYTKISHREALSLIKERNVDMSEKTSEIIVKTLGNKFIHDDLYPNGRNTGNPDSDYYTEQSVNPKNHFMHFSLKSSSLHVEIVEIEDEYFIVKLYGPIRIDAKCDQLDGFIKFIEDFIK